MGVELTRMAHRQPNSGYCCWLRYERNNDMGYCLDCRNWILLYLCLDLTIGLSCKTERCLVSKPVDSPQTLRRCVQRPWLPRNKLKTLHLHCSLRTLPLNPLLPVRLEDSCPPRCGRYRSRDTGNPHVKGYCAVYREPARWHHCRHT